MSDTQKNNWFQLLLDKITTLSEEFGLDDIQANRFRDFSVTLAKEQYRLGNKYGASWAFKKARETSDKQTNRVQPVV